MVAGIIIITVVHIKTNPKLNRKSIKRTENGTKKIYGCVFVKSFGSGRILYIFFKTKPGDMEMADHLFIDCNLFESIWYLICLWFGISFVCPGLLQDHFTQFIHMAGMPRSSHIYFKIIWLASTWAIWKVRNNCVFKIAVIDPYRILERVKLDSFL